MRDERSLREMKVAWSLANSAAREAGEESARAWYWLTRIPRMALCWVTGKHRWGEWRTSDLIFTPPENRVCRRCHVMEHRGDWPAFRVEAGSAIPEGTANVQYRWVQDPPA